MAQRVFARTIPVEVAERLMLEQTLLIGIMGLSKDPMGRQLQQECMMKMMADFLSDYKSAIIDEILQSQKESNEALASIVGRKE